MHAMKTCIATMPVQQPTTRKPAAFLKDTASPHVFFVMAGSLVSMFFMMTGALTLLFHCSLCTGA